jgi:4,5-DOPA dioxygenase extradiol
MTSTGSRPSCTKFSIRQPAVPKQRAKSSKHYGQQGSWSKKRPDMVWIPVSLQSHLGVGGAYQLGQALAPLRAQGFLIIGSGNITHNLGDYRLASSQQGASFNYLRAFPDWMKQQLQNHDLNALLDYRRRAPDAARAHPSDEHLQPLYVALGAAGPEAEVEQLHNGISDYVLAMDAYAFNASH